MITWIRMKRVKKLGRFVIIKKVYHSYN